MLTRTGFIIDPVERCQILSNSPITRNKGQANVTGVKWRTRGGGILYIAAQWAGSQAWGIQGISILVTLRTDNYLALLGEPVVRLARVKAAASRSSALSLFNKLII